MSGNSHHIDNWQKKHEQAQMHLVKELGPYYDIAVAQFKSTHGMTKEAQAGEEFPKSAVFAMQEEVIKQLTKLAHDGIPTRDGNHQIIIGRLDLTKLGLKAEQAKQRAAEIHSEELNNVKLYAAKELGVLYAEMCDKSGGSDKLAEIALKQLQILRDKGVSLRDEQYNIRTGQLNLKELGLSEEQMLLLQQRSQKQHANTEPAEFSKTEHRKKPITPMVDFRSHAEDTKKGTGTAFAAM